MESTNLTEIASFGPGVFTVLVTPFTETMKIDYTCIDKWLEYQYNSDVAGIVLLGTTSESPTLSREEQLEIVKYICTICTIDTKYSSSKKIIIGVGGNYTDETLNFTLQCINLNVHIDGFMVTVPSYNKPTQKGIVYHFNYICSNKSVSKYPIIMYNIPSRAGVNMEPNTIKMICDLCPNVIAIKEASGSIDQLIEIRKLVPALNVYSGDDKLVLDIMIHGGCGVISVASNVFPDIVTDIVDKCLTGKFKNASELYYSYDFPKMIQHLFCETNPIPVKYMLEKLQIFDNSLMRLPMTELSDDKKIIISKYIDNLQWFGENDIRHETRIKIKIN